MEEARMKTSIARRKASDFVHRILPHGLFTVAEVLSDEIRRRLGGDALQVSFFAPVLLGGEQTALVSASDGHLRPDSWANGGPI
jgi:hypothetical protein